MIRRTLSFVGGFLRDQWSQYTPSGQLLFALGLGAIIVDAGIAWEYGISMSVLHAAGFGLVAIALALLPDQAAQQYDRRNLAACAILAVSCLPLAGVAYQSHIGYGAAIRLGDMQQTGFQHATLDNSRATLNGERERLSSLQEQHKVLVAERAAAMTGNPWLTAATATALRDEVKVLDERIAAEVAGKRGRAPGCKAECERLQGERKGVLERIGAVERLDGITGRIAELDKSISETQAKIDTKTDAVAGMGYRSSTVVNQNTALGDLWHLVTGKEPPAKVVSLATMGNSSLAFLMLAPLFMFAAGRNRRDRRHTEPTRTSTTTTTAEAASFPPAIHTREIVTSDQHVWGELRDALRRADTLRCA